MSRKKPGRPPKGQARAGRDEILAAALEILDSEGPRGLSMRAVARRLNVNPMTLYHHVGDRAGLLCAVSDHVYAGVGIKPARHSDRVRRNIETLLIGYHGAVLRHPNLSLGIFATPGAFSKEARRITDRLLELLREAKLGRARTKLWLAILVDFTHGSAIAIAMSGSGTAALCHEYKRGLRELLNGLFAGAD